MNDIEFSYRLPLTFIRIVGDRTVSRDSITGTEAVRSQAVVTTETGADLLTRIRVELDIGSRDKQKSTWNFLPDGRLTGADVATTVDRYAEWAPYLKVGGFVLAAALPFVIPGPAGVIASVATLSATLKVSTFGPEGEAQPQEDPHFTAYCADEKVHGAADVLRRYRAALVDAEARVLTAAESGDFDGLRNGKLALEIVSARAALAEEKYLAWLDSRIERAKTEYDERLRVDGLPSKSELQEWTKNPSGSESWERLARDLGTAVTVDLLDPWERGSSVADRLSEFEPETSRDKIWWRRPRSAEIITWRLTPEGQGYALEQVEVQRLSIAFPGNERQVPLESADDTTRSVAVSFEADGALTKIVTDLTGVAQQRSADIGNLLTGVKDATTAGQEVGKALTPPSLVDQAAAAEAAAKLAPSSEDPAVTAMKKRLAAEELSARLRIAQQVATAESTPVVVRFDSAP